jgi:hypothetical protein
MIRKQIEKSTRTKLIELKNGKHQLCRRRQILIKKYRLNGIHFDKFLLPNFRLTFFVVDKIVGTLKK